MKKLCIYHGNCADGFGSAWVVNRAIGEDVEFFPGFYGQNMPLCEDMRDRDIIFVDFTCKRPVMLSIIEVAKSVLILDHHKSAMEDLEGLGDTEGVNIVFDMERSGAMITWNHYFPDVSPPKLIEYIQDRDLWRFKLTGTREIQAALFSYPYDFTVWNKLMMETGVSTLSHDGEAIERKHFKDVNELVKITTRRALIDNRNVPLCNIPYTLASDAGHMLAKGEFFSACYWDTTDGRVFGLRSEAEVGLDVSEIAVKYGGGGHKNAAGFKLSYKDAAKFEIEGE